MNWFDRNKAAQPSLADIAAAITELSQSLTDNDSGVQKGLRRLSLANKQQSDAITTLAQESISLQSTLAQRHGVILTHEKIIGLLDQLEKITLATNGTSNAAVVTPLITRATTELSSVSALEVLAEVGQIYPDQGCEVVVAIEDNQWEPGTVLEVLQQGYQTPNGDIVRVAKVVVCQEYQSKPIENEPSEKILHEETPNAF